MLKQIFVFLIFMVVTTQSFASGIPATNGIAQPSTCDTGTLETSTGPVQLRAEFTPEVINLRWYNDDARINVPTTSSTCTYGTAISLPQNPTKPGYKFAGWEVLQYDFSTLDANILGETHDAKSKSGSCRTNSSYCIDLQKQEWVVKYSYGRIYGISRCSDTVGARHDTADQITESNSGAYCWCKATEFVPNGSHVKYTPSKNLPWVNLETSDCAASCYYRCPPVSSSSFRAALFGKTTN